MLAPALLVEGMLRKFGFPSGKAGRRTTNHRETDSGESKLKLPPAVDPRR